MKKKLTINLVILLSTFGLFAQTIVNTSVENRKVILEEFTGMHCVFCPQGHAIAQSIQDNNPGDVFLINIHTGSFSVPGNGEPDFRTPWGSAIAGQSGLVGYPAGTVNRQLFPGQEQGSGTAMSRNQWNSASNQVLPEDSYVNVGVEADIDVSTNELVVHVEAYYTGNSPQNTNLLNVALLQNNTLGPQTGGNMGDEYVHMHRLIDMITGQWGIEIPTTTAGTFVDQTFTYPIPADHNGIPIEIADLEVVAYITETHQQIPSGSGVYPTFSGFANNNDAYVRYIEPIDPQCGFEFSPRVNIQNVGGNEITSLTINYAVNSGTTHTYNWSGSLTSLQNETIVLPAISYDVINGENTISISVENDDNNSNNSISDTFNYALETSNQITLILNTDNQGNQCTWNITDYNGEIIHSGGPYGNSQNINETFNLDLGCHQFNLFDSGNNGGGSIVLHDSNSEVIYSSSGNYGSGASASFAVSILGVNNQVLQKISIYPNPASSILTIQNAENASIEVYDILGKLILSKTNISIQQEIDVSKLQSGNYFIKIEKDNEIATKKFIVLK